jgi:choloylglycine hydrolase
MCTCIFTRTEDGKHFLGRTLDFAFDLKESPTFLPRDFSWETSFGEKMVNKFAILGASRDCQGDYLFTDGFNEKGLGIAILYYPGVAVYDKEVTEGKINLASWEFLLWILGNFTSIEELENNLKDVRLVEKVLHLLGTMFPLHFIIVDKTGRTVVIEPDGGELEIKENPVGILTNSPNLEWHIDNIRNYISVQPEQFAPKKYGDFIASPFSQASGTSELPGGYTPPQRFIRAVFFKQYIETAKNEEGGVTNIWQILNTVRIPRGIVLDNSEGEHYTQHLSAMCLETKTYYFSQHTNNQITKIELTNDLLDSKKPVQFNVPKKQMFNEM